MTVFKSKFVPVKSGEVACIGGPIECINNIANSAGAQTAVRYLSNFISSVSAGYAPKVDFYPSSIPEMERCLERFVDKDIPQIDTCLDNEVNTNEDYDSTEEESITNQVKLTKQEEVDNITCSGCGGTFDSSNKDFTVQAELRKFFEQQEAGLDTSFRCRDCRDCKECLKGAGEERKSLMQEAHQDIIKKSVYIDKKLGRAVAKLPFVQDPTGKLTKKTRLAAKRLYNVCKKYAKCFVT